MTYAIPTTHYAPPTMSEEQTEPLLRITFDDIADANQLSLGCPICAGAVEDNVTSQTMVPVKCTTCSTFYHHACWQNNGGKCAILGCESKAFSQHGAQDLGPSLVISSSDVARSQRRTRPVPTPTQIKKGEQRIQQEVTRRYWWQTWFQRLLRAIRILE